MKDLYKLILLVGLLTGSYGSIWAQVNKSQVVEKALKVSPSTVLKVTHNRGPLRVQQTNGNQIKMRATLTVKANTEEQAQAVIDHYQLEVEESGSTVNLKSDSNIRNWSTVNNRTTITFDNGTKIKGLQSLKVELLLLVPTIKSISLQNRYEDIYLENINNDLEVNLYSGELFAGDIAGQFSLTVKYGKANIGNVKDAGLNLYDSELEMKNGGNITLTSKYSRFRMNDAQSLKIDSYDDKMVIGKVAQRLDIKDKYSDFEITSFGDGDWDIYDGDLIAGPGRKVKIKSKYSSFNLETLDDLHFDQSYDDDLKIDKLTGFYAISKYSSFTIGQFTGSIFLNSYDDDLIIRQLSGNFEGMEFKGKYSKVDLPLPKNTQYQLQANLTYGKLRFPESELTFNTRIEKNSRSELQGKIKGAGDNAPKIIIEAYDSQIDLY